MSSITLFDNKTEQFEQLGKLLALGLHPILVFFLFPLPGIKAAPIGFKYTFYI